MPILQLLITALGIIWSVLTITSAEIPYKSLLYVIIVVTIIIFILQILNTINTIIDNIRIKGQIDTIGTMNIDMARYATGTTDQLMDSQHEIISLQSRTVDLIKCSIDITKDIQNREIQYAKCLKCLCNQVNPSAP